MEVINNVVQEFRIQLLIHLIKFLRGILDNEYRNFRKWYNQHMIDKLILIHPECSLDMRRYRGYFVHLDYEYTNFVIPPMTSDFVFKHKDISYRVKFYSDYTKHELNIDYENWNDYLYNIGPIYTTNDMAFLFKTIKKEINSINMYQIYDMAIEYMATSYEMKNLELRLGVGCIELRW